MGDHMIDELSILEKQASVAHNKDEAQTATTMARMLTGLGRVFIKAGAEIAG